MADSPESTTFIFVDRRKTGRGKSSNNRQKLLNRVKESIRNAKPEDLDASGVQKSANSQGHMNPVRVARNALAEPTFHYASSTGEMDIVLVGNDRWLKGDEFPIDSEGEGSGNGEGNGPGEDGEDDFIIEISRGEYYDVFFEDCELPDLQESHEKDIPEAVMKPAGFQKVGNPGQLAVIRSYKHSKGRRLALTRESREELAELEAELLQLMSEDSPSDLMHLAGFEWEKRVQEVTLRIQELKDKIASVGLYEDVDLRYRKSEKVQVKSTEAAFFMLMDISGSMDEAKKTMARKFFVLQYNFIIKKYPQTDLVFIAHTDHAEEKTEEEFFTTRENGGTIVSPAWALAHSIVKERYDSDQTNIYFSYAGDGDNWASDNPLVTKEILESGLLSKIRHAVYVQVGQTFAGGFGGYSMGGSLWDVMTSISNASKKLAVIKLTSDADVFDAFKKIYKKKDSK